MEIANALQEAGLNSALITFIISMVPVVELRGAIPIGVMLGLPVYLSMLISIIGNLVPVPFIILFVRRVFEWMRSKSRRLSSIVERLEHKAQTKGAKLYKGEIIGLILFVAIPLPGTGAWTGALIAALLDIRMKNAMPAITLGVLIAGVLVTGITLGFSSIL